MTWMRRDFAKVEWIHHPTTKVEKEMSRRGKAEEEPDCTSACRIQERFLQNISPDP